jgi:glycogen debranching enzyme
MFGRDSLIAARMLLPVDRSLAEGTLRALAARQGTKVDEETAEQPGKILHEVRRTEVSHDSEGFHLPPVYYGTIDATPLWISLLHDAWRAGMPEAEVAALLDNLEAALRWLGDYGDSDGDGFLEYLDTTGHGLANQGWKDSGDSIRWHDGSIAEGPIALCEVQAYAYEAALDGAALLDAFGRPGGDQWRAWAAAMKERFRAAFWCEDEQGRYPALALDAEKRPVDGVSSNIGHLLGTGILDPAEQRLVVDRLLDPTMFSGYGIRTLSTTNGAYWPLRYHAGSVWSHDTAIVVDGMLRDGFTEEAARVAEGLLRAAEGFDYRLPELFGGQPADEVWPPVPYPASCRPQAWAATSVVPVARALGALRPVT